MNLNLNEHEAPLVSAPYLVQRGNIRKPLKSGNSHLSQAVNLDYMGSAEFEFGALAKSLRALQADVDDIKLTVVTELVENDVPLRVLHTFGDAEWDCYFGYIKDMYAGNALRLKECAAFCPKERSSYMKPDFWWDIRNHVMWSFHKPFMRRIDGYLISSWKYMGEQERK